MCSRLNHYLQLFSTIRADKNCKRWGRETCHQAPHKPFLLLSIFDLIATRQINRNFVDISFDLAELFANYWSKVMPVGTSGAMSYPFYYLSSAEFWHLVEQPGVPHESGRTVSSVKRLRELYLGARFDDDLYSLLVMENSREKLRHVLVKTFFAEEVQPVILQQSLIHQGASFYCDKLLRIAEEKGLYQEALVAADEDTRGRIRDQGFRKAIVKLYQHRCALCGIRMLTPEGHTIVEAAHIVPWSKSQDDKPQNGLALCRLCHWSFDEGLMSVGRDYEVLISPAIRQDNNFPGHMETLSARGIFRPQVSGYWPAQENLDYHRTKIYRK